MFNAHSHQGYYLQITLIRMYCKFMQKLWYVMLNKLTNKCNKFVYITFVHINIKFMQKLKHAHAHYVHK